MPYANIQSAREGATVDQKAELICGATDQRMRVLNKDPATTFVFTEEVDTDARVSAGKAVMLLRHAEAAQGSMAPGPRP